MSNFLSDLHNTIWLHNTSWSKPQRKLTNAEWSRVQELLPSLVCMMGNSAFGFELALHVYEMPPDVPYPGVTRDKAKALITIAAAHMPWYEEGRIDTRWDRAWKEFSKFTHSAANIAKLKELGMEMPKNKSHYEY